MIWLLGNATQLLNVRKMNYVSSVTVFEFVFYRYVIVSDMPELAPAMQEAYRMPSSVAPCIVDDSAMGQPFDHDMSSRVSLDTSNAVTATPHSRPSHASPAHRTPPSHLPHVSPVTSPDQQFIPNLAPFGGSDDENDDGGDYNDDDGDVSSEAAEDVTLEPVRYVSCIKYAFKN